MKHIEIGIYIYISKKLNILKPEEQTPHVFGHARRASVEYLP